MLELTEIDDSNWRLATSVEVLPEQLAFVANHQPIALEVLAKCHVRADGRTWTPYLALLDREPVGVVAVVELGDSVQLRHMAIDHRQQGRGIGRLMVDAVVAKIRDTRPTCEAIIVTAHPDNKIALRLYRSAGFADTGAVTDEFTGTQPILRLDLEA